MAAVGDGPGCFRRRFRPADVTARPSDGARRWPSMTGTVGPVRVQDNESTNAEQAWCPVVRRVLHGGRRVTRLVSRVLVARYARASPPFLPALDRARPARRRNDPARGHRAGPPRPGGAVRASGRGPATAPAVPPSPTTGRPSLTARPGAGWKLATPATRPCRHPGRRPRLDGPAKRSNGCTLGTASGPGGAPVAGVPWSTAPAFRTCVGRAAAYRPGPASMPRPRPPVSNHPVGSPRPGRSAPDLPSGEAIVWPRLRQGVLTGRRKGRSRQLATCP